MVEQFCCDLNSMIEFACVNEFSSRDTKNVWNLLIKANEVEKIRKILQCNPSLRFEFFEVFYSIFYLHPKKKEKKICDFPIEGFFIDLDLSKISQERFRWFQNFLWERTCEGRFREILEISEMFLR